MADVFDGEIGLRHCKGCDSPEAFPGEINPYGYCFGCSDGDEAYGKPQPRVGCAARLRPSSAVLAALRAAWLMPRRRGPAARPGFIPLGTGQRQNAQNGALEPLREPQDQKPSTDTSGAPDGSQTLVLDGFPTIAEVKLLGPNGGTANRYALGKARRAVQARVFVQSLRQGIRFVPPPVRVTLRYVFPDDRHRDADNFAVIGKPVIDGLVKSQILEGDNAARLTHRVEFVREAGVRRLDVIIESAREGER